MKTEEILREIYQELKKEMLENKGQIVKQIYTIPSVNYSDNSANVEKLYFASEIEMELERMMEQFENKVFYANYKDEYFFSTDKDILRRSILIKIENEETEELRQKLFTKVDNELEVFKQKLKQNTPERIIENAYELVIKEEIAIQLKQKPWYYRHLVALVKEKDLLSQLYKDCVNSSTQLGDFLCIEIEDKINLITDKYNEERLNQSRNTR